MNSLPSEGRVFSSWKEIALYLGKGVRTVQRWEKTLGLPVSRPAGAASNIVVATEAALQKWIEDSRDASARASANRNVDTSAQFTELTERLAQIERNHSEVEARMTLLQSRIEELSALLASEDSGSDQDGLAKVTSIANARRSRGNSVAG